MLRLAEALGEACISQRALARASGLSSRAANDLVRHGAWPKRQRAEDVRGRVRAALIALGMPAGVADDARLFEELPEPRGNAAPAGATPSTTMEAQMLIRKQRLSNAAREAFGLSADALEPPTREERVFLAGEMLVGFEHLLAKARFGGALALAGESGAGKTTLKDLLVTRLAREGEVLVIEPHVQAMEANDKAGKTLKAAHIAAAILREVAPLARPRADSEARLAQVGAALAESADGNARRRHLLVIDEAHCLPIATLKHLKRFFEFKRRGRGLQPALLTIVLLGQPEIVRRLSTYDMEVREVWQRCELATLRPLDRDLPAYLKFQLGAAAAAFDDSALEALRTVLTDRDHKRSFLYPLAINNWLAAILNTAAALGAKRISGETVDEVRKDMDKELMAGGF